MKLIFVRHGIAQDKDLGIPDEVRQLTPSGRQELKDAAPYLASYLKEELVRSITSPLLRAVQTAEVFEEEGLPQAEVRDFAATGDFEELKRALREMPGSLPVIFGHSPSLDDWIRAITDQQLEMKKGGAAMLDVSNEEDFTGQLLWYLPPRKYRRLGKAVASRVGQFEDDVDEVVRRSVSVIRDHRERFLNQPGEIESVHKLRVKIRQLRSLLSLLKPLLAKKKYRRLQDALRRMAKECAYLRELDVIMQVWQSQLPLFEQHGLSGQTFLRILQQERSAEQERLERFLKGPGFVRELKRIQRQILRCADLSRAGAASLNDMVAKTLSAWHENIRTGYEAIDQNELETIHALRIQAKKLRYVMEVFGLDEGQKSAAMYREIRNWQETLGAITDANRNAAAVQEIAERYPDEPIEEELRLFDENQRQRADRLYQAFFSSRSHEADLDMPDQNQMN